MRAMLSSLTALRYSKSREDQTRQRRRAISFSPPVPGQQLVEPMSRMCGDAQKNVGEPRLRIDAVHFGGDDEAVRGGGALAAAVRAAEL